MSSLSTWKREHHERIKVARSPVHGLLQLNRRRNRELSHDTNSNPLPAKWTSGSAARYRPDSLHEFVGDIPSVASSRWYVVPPAAIDAIKGTDVERISRTKGQMQTRGATQTAMEEEADDVVMGVVGLQSEAGICLGAFGDVGKMTAKTVDFLIHVLEDRKQELVMNGEDKNISGRTSDAVKDDASEEGKDSSVPNVSRIPFNTTNNDSAHVTELGRSHSYEALVQLEEILEARHNRLMNDEILESTDAS
ncbi:unnamed protein product [Peronospora destructor]|uniref:Uncharacterized protein n=1 Tax=Peronospora destructor TaxID=86335 RepID=A0AAV0TTQ3_9STRA|nr:unnamed protein product [Peronospora destructor]